MGVTGEAGSRGRVSAWPEWWWPEAPGLVEALGIDAQTPLGSFASRFWSWLTSSPDTPARVGSYHLRGAFFGRAVLGTSYLQDNASLIWTRMASMTHRNPFSPGLCPFHHWELFFKPIDTQREQSELCADL